MSPERAAAESLFSPPKRLPAPQGSGTAVVVRRKRRAVPPAQAPGDAADAAQAQVAAGLGDTQPGRAPKTHRLPASAGAAPPVDPAPAGAATAAAGARRPAVDSRAGRVAVHTTDAGDLARARRIAALLRLQQALDDARRADALLGELDALKAQLPPALPAGIVPGRRPRWDQALDALEALQARTERVARSRQALAEVGAGALPQGA